MDTRELHCILPRATPTLPTNRRALKLQANQSTSAAAIRSGEEGAPRSSVPLSHWMILGLVVILCLLELGAYRTHGVIPVIASRAWALMGLIYFGATGMLIGGSLLSDLRQRKFVFAVLVIGLGIMVFYGLGNFYHLPINYESAAELASFLKYNIHKPDWGYTLGGYGGKPARQFIIPAIPSLLFGNDVFWLHFGYAIVFYSGVLCFFLGVRHYFSIKQHGELWALFTVLSCFTFPQLMEARYGMGMDQAILPVTFVMHALGWFLLSLEKLTPPRVLILAWIAGLLGTSYTPALAAWMLFQSFFLFVLVRGARQGRRAQIVLWVSVWAYTLTFGLCSFLTRGDINLTPQAGHSAQSFLIGLKVFFLGYPREYMPAPIAILVAIFFLLALTGRLGFIKWITAGWFLVVVYFSATSAGYSQYDPVYTMSRSILLIPIMMLACWDSYLGLFDKFKPLKRIEPFLPEAPWPVSRSNILAVILCLAAAATTVHVYYEREKSYGPASQEFLISFLLNKADSAGIHYQPASLISNTTQVAYHPIRYCGEYFFPLWQISILPTDSLKLAKPNQSQPLLVITDTEIAHKDLLPAGWTGTDQITYLDASQRRFPVRYGLYRYSP